MSTRQRSVAVCKYVYWQGSGHSDISSVKRQVKLVQWGAESTTFDQSWPEEVPAFNHASEIEIGKVVAQPNETRDSTPVTE